MPERITVVTCLFFLEKVPFSGLKLHQYNLGEALNVEILEKKRVELRP